MLVVHKTSLMFRREGREKFYVSAYRAIFMYCISNFLLVLIDRYVVSVCVNSFKANHFIGQSSHKLVYII